MRVPNDIFDTSVNFEMKTPSYNFSDIGFLLNNDPLTLTILHPNYGNLFDTNGYSLLFYDKYIELTWEFQTDLIFGVG